MNIDKLQIDTSNQQIFELNIEFPLSVLAGYNGISNLDETWDDNIMYIINQSLSERGVSIKNAKIEIVPESRNSEEMFAYHLILMSNLPRLDINYVIASLTKENFQKGLRILKGQNFGARELLYQDTYYDET